MQKLSENVRLFASLKNWIEGTALSQLKGTASLPGMELAVGLPDLHPGKCGPVGAAFVSRAVLYPHLIGTDVGCGMGLWQSDLSARKLKLDRWEHKLTDLDQPWSGDARAWLEGFAIAPSAEDAALGTIGGGNHFAELQRVESVDDRDACSAMGLDADRLAVLVHSGSRALGREVLLSHQLQHGYAPLAGASDEAAAYMQLHDYAVTWAKASRALIAQRFLRALGSDARAVFDLSHNFVEKIDADAWLHRKGANPATRGALVIPGSRGTLSYLVAPCGEQAANAWSLAHGAGRKWNRSDCRARLRDRYDPQDLVRTELGSRVICEDRELLYEEAPQAYKNVDVVVNDLVEAGLVRVIARLRPLITYKVRRNGG